VSFIYGNITTIPSIETLDKIKEKNVKLVFVTDRVGRIP
jgi:hypothetical protein